MKKEVKKLTFEQAEKNDIETWKSVSPEIKLDMVQQLRELYYELNNESRKGFQRLYRIIKHT